MMAPQRSISVSVFIGMAVSRLRDQMEEDGQEIELWVYHIIRQNPKQVKCDGLCWVCGKRKAIQLHHIAGEKHDDRLAPVCLECHTPLSNEQKIWGPRWWQPGQPEHIREEFFLRGLRDILKQRATETRNMYYARLADMFTEEISKRMRQ